MTLFNDCLLSHCVINKGYELFAPSQMLRPKRPPKHRDAHSLASDQAVESLSTRPFRRADQIRSQSPAP